MNLTPFTVYLIMQADTIWVILMVLAIVFFIATIVVLIMRGVALSESWDDEDIARIPSRTKLIAATLFFLAATALMPSTKTLCVTVLAPAIADSKAVQQDLPELYNLAVGKLREQLAPAEEKKGTEK